MFGKLKIKYDTLKIKEKLIIVFIILIIVPVLVLSIFTTYFTEYSTTSEVMKSMQETTKKISESIDNEISATMNTMVQVISDKKLQDIVSNTMAMEIVERYDDVWYIKERMNTAFITSFSVENVYICSYKGVVYTADKNYLSLTKEYDFTRTGWFQEMSQNNIDSIITSKYDVASIIEEGTQPKIFSIIKKIYDEKGKEIGCIIVDMDCNMIGGIIQNNNDEKIQNIMITDNDKKIIYHYQDKYIGTQFRSSYISEALSIENGYVEDVVDNKLVAFSKSSVTNWNVIYEMKKESVLNNTDRFKIILYSTMILISSIAIFYAIRVSKSFSNPIMQLQSYMKEVENGDFDVRVEVKNQDEIGDLASSFDKMVKETKTLIQDVYQSEIYQKEAELNALQAQINPHFLYNTLQTIDMIAEAEGMDHISDACQALSKIFRYSINRGQEFVLLSEELNHIRNYMIIQKLRYSKRINMQYDISEKCERLYIVKLLVQPLVENSIIHGLENSIGVCTVIVRAYEKESNLIIEVEDDGDGIEEQKLSDLNQNLKEYSKNKIVHDISYDDGHRSIGLENTNARIKLYFGDEYGITIRSIQGEGTIVALKLPKKNI